MDVTVEASKFDLFMEVCERLDCMEGRLLYSTEIWDAATIRRMVAHWIVLLQSVCRNPASTLGDLTLLTPEENAALLDRAAGTIPLALPASHAEHADRKPGASHTVRHRRRF